MAKIDKKHTFFSNFAKSCQRKNYIWHTVLNSTESTFYESFKSFGSYLQLLQGKKFPKMTQQMAVVTLLHSGNSTRFSQIIFCFKTLKKKLSLSESNFTFTELIFPKFCPKSSWQGLKRSNFHAILTLITKELYTVLASYMDLSPSSWRWYCSA